eukprot:scaffold566294_cov47-Prasinocladus_malaysianus.AAC.1
MKGKAFAFIQSAFVDGGTSKGPEGPAMPLSPAVNALTVFPGLKPDQRPMSDEVWRQIAHEVNLESIRRASKVNSLQYRLRHVIWHDTLRNETRRDEMMRYDII